MGIDVMIVSPAEEIASRPSDGMLEWLDNRFEDYEIRYGYISLNEEDIHVLRSFTDDPVAEMLLSKATKLRTSDDPSPYIIELMISA